LVGIAIEAIVSETELSILGHKDVDAKRLRKWLGDLEKLPPLPTFADKIDVMDRFVMLQAVQSVERFGPSVLMNERTFDKLAGVVDRKVKYTPDYADWGEAMGRINFWCDRLATAMRMRDRPERAKQMDVCAKELTALGDRLVGKAELNKAFAAGNKIPPKTRGAMFGDAASAVLISSLTRCKPRRIAWNKPIEISMSPLLWRCTSAKADAIPRPSTP
jgi:hypothetical protein